jgi:hypothetical protein
VNPAPASEYGNYPFAGRSTITDPSAYTDPRQRIMTLASMSNMPAEQYSAAEWRSAALEYKQIQGKDFSRDSIYNGLWTKAAALENAAGKGFSRDAINDITGFATEEGLHAQVGMAMGGALGRGIGNRLGGSVENVLNPTGREANVTATQIGARGEAEAIKNGGTVELFTDSTGPKVPGAVGVGPTDPTAVATNAMNMPNIPTGSQAIVVASNPYIPKSAGGTFSMMDYLPEAARITKGGGEIVINGNAPNKYFSNMPTATELDAMGLTIKYQGTLLPEYKGMSFTTTQGKPIDVETMMSIVFVKKAGTP